MFSGKPKSKFEEFEEFDAVGAVEGVEPNPWRDSKRKKTYLAPQSFVAEFGAKAILRGLFGGQSVVRRELGWRFFASNLRFDAGNKRGSKCKSTFHGTARLRGWSISHGLLHRSKFRAPQRSCAGIDCHQPASL